MRENVVVANGINFATLDSLLLSGEQGLPQPERSRSEQKSLHIASTFHVRSGKREMFRAWVIKAIISPDSVVVEGSQQPTGFKGIRITARREPNMCIVFGACRTGESGYEPSSEVVRAVVSTTGD